MTTQLMLPTETETLQDKIAAIVASEFDFTVDKLELTAKYGLKPGIFGLFRSDNGEFVGGSSVAEGYVPHSPADVAALIEAASSLFPEGFDVECLWRKGKGHWVFIQPTAEERRKLVGTNDPIFPRLIVRAPYNKRAFSVTIGLYRDACTNLVMLRSVKGATISINHTSHLPERMDELITTIGQLDGMFDEVHLACVEMAGKQFVFDEVYAAINPKPEKESRQEKWQEKKDAIRKRIEIDRLHTRGYTGNLYYVNGWELFNAVQGYAQHDKIRQGDPASLEKALKAEEDAEVVRCEVICREGLPD